MNETERGMPSTGAPSSSAIPEHIPARMLNEFVYCPRLFYLEWVDHRWADSADTEQGRFTHRASDRREGSLPDPEFAAILKNVSSVRIQSDRLGLVAVIDRVEGEDGYVCPVDIKKGRPDPDGLPWPADRVQALAQAALLKDAGYRVRKAVLYYAETHQRVDVPVTPEGLDEVTEIAARAREVACRPRPPLPLVHSPKCPRCSLLGLCLPDETNALLARDDLPVRTILPRDPDHRPLYVTEQGAYVVCVADGSESPRTEKNWRKSASSMSPSCASTATYRSARRHCPSYGPGARLFCGSPTEVGYGAGLRERCQSTSSCDDARPQYMPRVASISPVN